MKTKDKILHTALTLFNQEGSEKVSTRHIADAIPISVGNLYYHFKDKQAIISQLYEQLVGKLDTGFDHLQVHQVGLPTFMQAIFFTCNTLYDYRFLMLDFVHIMRNIPSIKTHYQQLTVKRKNQFLLAIQLLIQQQMVSEKIHEIPFDYLQMQFTILGDFWISEAEILYQGNEEEKLQYFAKTMLYNLFPHLTEAGKMVFKETLNTLFLRNESED